MARSAPVKGMRKVDHVRGVLEKDPKMTATAVVKTLSESGVKVTPGFVYYVKNKASKARRKAKREKAATAMGSMDSVQLILKVRALAAECGGIRKLKQLVDIFAE
ncbi:MAG: hypothetical protein K1X57_11210 [Gemmataceae bacterium]|nr:hypothetical protein [Gemmataceae bacterium]